MWPELSSIRIVPGSRASLRSLIEPAGMLIASLRTLIGFTRIRTQAGLAPVQREKRDGRDDSKTPKILYSKKTRERGSKKTV